MEGVEGGAPLPGDFRVIVCPTPPQINDFCDLLGTPYAPVSKIAPVNSSFGGLPTSLLFQHNGLKLFLKKYQIFREGQNILKKSPNFFDIIVKHVGRFFSNFVAFSEYLNFNFSTTCVFLKDQSYYCVDILEGGKRDCSFRYDFNPPHIHLETLALRNIYFVGFEIILLYTFSSF